jgi:hypothetical protein
MECPKGVTEVVSKSEIRLRKSFYADVPVICKTAGPTAAVPKTFNILTTMHRLIAPRILRSFSLPSNYLVNLANP